MENNDNNFDFLIMIERLQLFVKEWTKLAKAQMKSFDITYPQYRVLLGLKQAFDENKRMSQKELSDLIGSDVMTVSTMLRQLEQKRLVRRSESRSDTRMKYVFISSIGLNVVDEVTPLLRARAEDFIEEWSVTNGVSKDIILRLSKMI